MKPSIGRVVQSLSGRDAGTFYLVIDKKGDRVFLVDGKTHKIKNPKIKNIKHIAITEESLPSVTETILSGKPFGNGKLKKILNSIAVKTSRRN